MLINCSVDISIKQNNTIAWVQFDPNMLISKTFKYICYKFNRVDNS